MDEAGARMMSSPTHLLRVLAAALGPCFPSLFNYGVDRALLQ